MKKKMSAYAQAGVDIDKKMSGIASIKKMVKKTATRSVISDIGLFGGLFESPGTGKILVASTDGVGTKLKVAAIAGRHDTVGQDIVNHCVNDILVQGATPLFFLDYIGTSVFNGKIFGDVVKGMCKACRENNCALLGGETAEMPGLYPPNEYDLVGTIVGVVDRKNLIAGKTIKPGDAVIGLPSTGLQTNGYSLARRVILEKEGLKPKDKLPGTNKTVAEILLAVHGSFLKPITTLMKSVQIHGMAHITGGGFYDNIPRVLPADVSVLIDRNSWNIPEVYDFIRRKGNVDRDEMYRVFNMGIGYVVIVREKDCDKTIKTLRKSGCKAKKIGFVMKGRKDVVMLN